MIVLMNIMYNHVHVIIIIYIIYSCRATQCILQIMYITSVKCNVKVRGVGGGHGLSVTMTL